MPAAVTFRPRIWVRFGMIAGVVLAAAAIPGAVDTTGKLVGGAMFGLLVLAAAALGVRRVSVDELGVEKRTLLGRKRIDFDDLGHASFEREGGPKTLPMRTIRLSLRGKTIIGSIVVRTLWWERRHAMLSMIEDGSASRPGGPPLSSQA